MRRRRLAVELTTVICLAAIVLGVWLPWLVVHPEHTGPVPRFYISGMRYGIEASDWWILGVAGLGVGNAVDLSGRRDRAAGVAGAVAGTGALLLTLLGVESLPACLYLPEPIAFGHATDCVYVYGPGIFLTALGGALLALAGGYQFLTATDE